MGQCSAKPNRPSAAVFKAGLRFCLHALSAQLFGSVICAERMQISGVDKQTDGSSVFASSASSWWNSPWRAICCGTLNQPKVEAFINFTESQSSICMFIPLQLQQMKKLLKIQVLKITFFFFVSFFFYLNFIFKRNLCLALKRLFTVFWSSSWSLSRFDLTGKVAYCASHTEAIQMCFMLWDTFKQKFMFFKTFVKKMFFGLPIGRQCKDQQKASNKTRISNFFFWWHANSGKPWPSRLEEITPAEGHVASHTFVFTPDGSLETRVLFSVGVWPPWLVGCRNRRKKKRKTATGQLKV